MNLKKIVLNAVAILIVLATHSQRPPNVKYDCYTIDLTSGTESIRIAAPYTSIIVADERSDTMKAGYYYPGIKDINCQKICFEKGLTHQLTAFFNSDRRQTTATPDRNVLACIKTLWFGNYDTIHYTEYVREERTRKLYLKIEFYRQDESCYQPLYRFDTTINLTSQVGIRPADALRSALEASVRRLTNTGLASSGSACLTRPQIDSFNRRHHGYAILKEEVAEKGVYLSFEQFRDNKPQYTKFRRVFATGKLDKLFVPGQNGKDSAIVAWAVSEGDKMFIQWNGNYFQMFRSGANYDFYGSDFLYLPFRSTPQSWEVRGGRNHARDVDLLAKRKPFQLDITTGKVY